jgi:hypothetical protein
MGAIRMSLRQVADAEVGQWVLLPSTATSVGPGGIVELGATLADGTTGRTALPHLAQRTNRSGNFDQLRPSVLGRSENADIPLQREVIRRERKRQPRRERSGGVAAPALQTEERFRNADPPRSGTRAEAGSAPAWPASSEWSPCRSWDRRRNAFLRLALR